MTVSMQGIPTKIKITTERLCIHSYQDKDFKWSVALYGDEKNTVYFDHGKPRSHEEVTQLVQAGQKYFELGKAYGLFSLFKKESGEFVGHIDFMPVEGGKPNEAEIGYIIDPRYQRQGYATEAITALVKKFIPFLNGQKGYCLTEVMATFHFENTASERVASRLGMSLEKEEPRFGSMRKWYRMHL